MTRAEFDTTSGIRNSRSHMIWCVLLLALGGCESSRRSTTTHLVPSQPSVRHPATVVPTDNQHVRDAEMEELGSEMGREIPVVQRPAPMPVLSDPGAIALVQAISDRLGTRTFGADGVSRIGLMQVKNQSRATSAEFDAFRERFVSLLNHASSVAMRGNLDFVSDANQQVHYHVQGAAYLITLDGFEMWELFLTMTPADQPHSIWQGDHPIHVLRQPHPGQPQVMTR